MSYEEILLTLVVIFIGLPVSAALCLAVMRLWKEWKDEC
jgi:hypothetical protein